MKQYFSTSELKQLARNANSFEELKNIATWLKWLWALGEKIDLKQFEKFSHIRLRQIL